MGAYREYVFGKGRMGNVVLQEGDNGECGPAGMGEWGNGPAGR